MNVQLMRCIRLVLPLAVMALVLCSCRKEPLSQFGNSNPNIIPVVKSVSTKAVSAQSQPGRLLSERVVSTAHGYELVEMVYENGNAPMASYVNTKGKVVTTDNIKTDGFKMMAYAEDEWYDNTIATGEQGSYTNKNGAGLYFVADCENGASGWNLSKTEGPARKGPDGELYWINNVPLTFWSYNLKKPTRTSTYSANFDYTVQESTASGQEDLVFAFSKESRKYYDDGTNYGTLESQTSTSGASGQNVNVWFFHALSAVQFVQDNNPDYSVSKIEIQNVNSKTSCVMTGSDNTPSSSTPNITFAHTPSEEASFSQEYTSSDASLQVPSDPDNAFKTDDAKTFFMIPQTLPSDAKLKVTFVSNKPSSDETTSPTFPINGEWKAGMYYMYKVNLAGSIKVQISENVNNTTKSDVRFNNTSNVYEYIRAAVVANWYDADGNVVAAWTGSITPGTGWTSGTDGFYYHTAKVAPGSSTANLISSFTKPTTAPVSGAHFEMTILVQAVASDGISSCTSAFQ